jgi:hypothetical protein
MMLTGGSFLIAVGLLVLFMPARLGAVLLRLNRIGRAPDYWYFDPDRIRSSRGLRAAYYFNGVCLILAGLYLVGLLPTIVTTDARGAVARLFGFLMPAFFLCVGVRSVIDPGWFERWAAKPQSLNDRAYRFRLKGYPVIGVLFIALALYMLWSFIRAIL